MANCYITVQLIYHFLNSTNPLKDVITTLEHICIKVDKGTFEWLGWATYVFDQNQMLPLVFNDSYII